MAAGGSRHAAFGGYAALVLCSALLGACSVAPVAPSDAQGAAAAPAVAGVVAQQPSPASPAPSAAPRAGTRVSAGGSAESAIRKAAGPLPPLAAAGIDEVREVKDPLPLAHAIDLTVSPDDLWVRIRNGFGMRNLSSPLVLDRQIWYTTRPSVIKTILERSRRYLYHIVEELERRGMPTELALLPMVESAFNPMAYSRARASGLWQFIPSTGKRYDLEQNWWYDARRDIIASTAAALDYLQFLYDMHGDWQLALASYNWGENAVARAIERNKAKGLPSEYQDLDMPLETRYYVPKLQALKNIIASPKSFGIHLDPIPNQPYFVTVEKKHDIDIRTAAKLAELPVAELIALNPAFNRPVITAAQSQTLVLPADRVEVFQENLENHDKPLSSWRTYRLKPGEKLERVAAAHGIPLARLKKVNGIGPRTRVPAGHQIIVPVKGSRAGVEPLPAVFQPPAAPEPRLRKVVHTVRKGDTLLAIARRYRVSTDDLRRWNPIGRLAAGQKLVIMQPQASAKIRQAPHKGKAAKPAQRKARPAAPAKPARRSARG